jgi:hypothetical protein
MDEPRPLTTVARERESLALSAPARPFLRPQEWGYWPFFLARGHRPSIGWQYRTEAKGGPCYLVGRDTVMGERKILRRFPFTDEGWQQAWRFLVGSDPVQAQRVRAELEEREVEDRAAVRLADLDSLAMAKLPAVKLLGGYAPNIDIAPDAHYDIRFLPERLVVTPAGTDEILIDLLYGDVEGVDIGGPGEVTSWSRVQRVEFIAGLATIGRFLAADTNIRTIIRLRPRDGELYFLCDTVTPDDLRVRLSRPLLVIRRAREARSEAAAALPAPAAGAGAGAAGVVGELSRLASLLHDGLLSRDEFERLKAKLIGGS